MTPMHAITLWLLVRIFVLLLVLTGLEAASSSAYTFLFWVCGVKGAGIMALVGDTLLALDFGIDHALPSWAKGDAC